MTPRHYLLLEANNQQLEASPPEVAVLPWGAVESHNYHLPYGTDVLESSALAERAAAVATAEGAHVIVLPAIPFGNDEQQLDQSCAISITTTTAYAVLRDVVRSITKQGIDRLILVNGHGGNQFKPLIRDIQGEFEVLIVLVDFFDMAKDEFNRIFENPGDHADEFETSVMLHLYPELVQMEHARPGDTVPFGIEEIKQQGVWTPRPWSASHPDTGCGDPSLATAEKGKAYCDAVEAALSRLMVGLAKAEKGCLPYQ
ncbi:MAG: amidase [Planctomycetaceae bacterium]|nr:amidase [Planctomycetaceae bacterium]|tara:strand:- start:172 stop:942 length:771 start_codon:yes stop_codon:yes gene_type:complete